MKHIARDMIWGPELAPAPDQPPRPQSPVD